MIPSTLARLPPLDLVRGFVAVGRRLSVTLASQDLDVTPSAVSRQVRALEEFVGARLIRRGHRSISLTAEGESLFRAANASLQQLHEALASFGGVRGRRPVTLAAGVGVTALWLVPRLARFQRRHPAINLRVSASEQVHEAHDDGVEVQIRYAAHAERPDATRLFGESLVPVVHPSLPADSPAALAQLALLEYDDPRRPWLQWAAHLPSLGLEHRQPLRMLRFNHYDQVVKAAAEGQGIALGRVELLDRLLAEGALVAVPGAGPPRPGRHAYWLTMADEAPRQEARDLADWILEEAGVEPP